MDNIVYISDSVKIRYDNKLETNELVFKHGFGDEQFVVELLLSSWMLLDSVCKEPACRVSLMMTTTTMMMMDLCSAVASDVVGKSRLQSTGNSEQVSF